MGPAGRDTGEAANSRLLGLARGSDDMQAVAPLCLLHLCGPCGTGGS